MTNPDPSTLDLSATPVSDQPTPETPFGIIARVIGWMKGHVAMTEGRPLTLTTLNLLPSTQQCQTIAIELQTALDAARAELERVKAERNDRQTRLETAQTDIVNLRADLAAAREENIRLHNSINQKPT
jgi:hypothetical protein